MEERRRRERRMRRIKGRVGRWAIMVRWFCKRECVCCGVYYREGGMGRKKKRMKRC